MFVDNANDVSERKRFESFKLGGGLPSGVTPSHSHRRSHSRNVSVSLPGLNAPAMSKPTSPEADQSSTLQPSNKRHSHHKRRSSVSTRTESAELMGISIPNLPTSSSEDNVNLGEKDSIRRRALWALEGKPDLSYSKVEIPELSDSASEKTSFDFSTKSSPAPNAMPNFGPGLMSNKRDSFKLLAASSSSKDQLGTLIEEEEEEDESPKTRDNSVKMESEASTVVPDDNIPVKSVSRPRPATLNLKPLSLTPDSISNAGAGLPTPVPTPSPQLTHKALNATEDSTTVTITRDETSNSKPRLPLNIKINNFGEPRRSSLPMSPEDVKSGRRSSIGYKTSSNGVVTNFAGLPTPEITPTSFERRFSLSDPLRRASTSTTASGDDEVFANHPTQSRPLSASEQHFLVKSHNALLARITDLERALSMRRMSSGGFSGSAGSRPMSMVSDLSSSSDMGGTEPNDEMLRLVADLKAERDELKRDVDGWRTRVADMEKQLSVVAGRVETERRDAWVARSMSGLLEVEKRTLERKLEAVEKSASDLQNEKNELGQQNTEMKSKISALESELEQLRNMNTAKVQGLHQMPLEFTMKRFTSVDSGSSATDVEDLVEGSPKAVFELRSVAEEEEHAFSDDDNGLAGYEDEDEFDPDMSFHSSSSFDSNSPRSTTHLELNHPVSAKAESMPVTNVDTPEIQAPRPTHASRASLSKTWTFPRGVQFTAPASQADNVDNFFECFKDEDSDRSRSPSSPLDYSYEKSKGLFAAGFKYATEDDTPPFFFPSGVGTDSGKLDAVAEEDEEEEVQKANDDLMFGHASGIQITFTPPQEEDDKGLDVLRNSTSILGLPADDPAEESSSPFNFGRPVVSPPTPETPPRLSRAAAATPPSTSRPSSATSSPSSIPRSISLRSTTRTSSPSNTPPNLSRKVRPTSTSPTKRSGPPPSFIPQPKLSSPMRRVSNPIRSTSLESPSPPPLRQPQFKSLKLVNGMGPSGSGYGSNHRSLHRSHAAVPVRRASSEIMSIDLSDPTTDLSFSTTPNTTISSPPNPSIEASITPKSSGLLSSSLSSYVPSPRSTFQTFTSFIPNPWSQRPVTPANAIEATRPPAPPATAPYQRTFVSKEAQLQKLRVRLAREGSLKTKTSVNVSCKRCDDDVVSL